MQTNICAWHAIRRIRRVDSGSVAVEFALVCPVLIMMIMGIFQAGMVMATINGLEQISAGAARSAVGGLSDSERVALASAYVASNAATYPYINPTQLQVTTSNNDTQQSFTVTTSYNLSANVAYLAVKSMMPNLQPILQRSATIQQGGY